MNGEETTSCLKCEGDVELNDAFCRHCGMEGPALGMSWDWREQPDLSQLNGLLLPYGCRVVKIETNSDQHAIRIERVTVKKSIAL